MRWQHLRRPIIRRWRPQRQGHLGLQLLRGLAHLLCVGWEPHIPWTHTRDALLRRRCRWFLRGGREGFRRAVRAACAAPTTLGDGA